MKLKILFFFTLLIGFNSCTKDFEEINTNPNVPTAVNPQFLLSNIIWNTMNNQAVDAWNAGNYLGQLMARKDFNEVDRWDLRSNQELWDQSYLLLRDIQTLIDLGQSDQPTYAGVALVMRGYLAANLTDLWGDVPYFEAIQGENQGNFTPRYDTQEAIYTAEGGILSTLEEAVRILEENQSGLAIQGDVLYDGDLEQWIRFANSLRIRYLLRISNRQDVGEAIQAIVDDGRIMTSNADDALVPYLSTAPNQWFVHNIRSGDFGDVRMSTTIEEVLNNLDDPRLMTWFRPTEASLAGGNPEYTGMPNGIGPATRSNYDFSEVSQPGPMFRDVPDGVDAVLMHYAELQFALAEAAERDWINGAAADYYEEGIRASFDYFGTTLPSDYLERTTVALTDDTTIEKIITQKWLASMLVGYEGWLNYRRTGFPALQIAVENLNNDEFPVRYIYPATEQALNAANYQEAVSRMGSDNHSTKGWWEQQ